MAEVWPDEHRRFVAETTQYWLREMPQTSGRLWLLRSPWPSWTLSDTPAAMRRWLERRGVDHDHGHDHGDDLLLPSVADFLRWDESEVRRWR